MKKLVLLFFALITTSYVFGQTREDTERFIINNLKKYNRYANDVIEENIALEGGKLIHTTNKRTKDKKIQRTITSIDLKFFKSLSITSTSDGTKIWLLFTEGDHCDIRAVVPDAGIDKAIAKMDKAYFMINPNVELETSLEERLNKAFNELKKSYTTVLEKE